MNAEEKQIIYHRIIAEKPLKLREIADMHGVSPEAIRQKQEKALGKIRNFIKNTGLLNKNFDTSQLIANKKELLCY